MLKQLNQCDADAQEQSECDGEADEKLTNAVLMSTDDMEFEMELAQDEEGNEMEFIVNKNEVKLVIGDSVEVVDIDDNEIEG